MNDKLNQIREIEFHNLKIGGETSVPIFRPVFVLNTAIFNVSENFQIVKDFADVKYRRI